MSRQSSPRFIIFLIVLVVCGQAFIPLSVTQSMTHTTTRTDVFDGQILFAPMYSKTTYLITNSGAVNHTWSSNYWPYWSAYMLNDGTLFRTIQTSNEEASHGGIEKYSSDGTVVWHFEYFSPNEYTTDHDFKPLPNGNVLMIVAEVKTRTDAIAMGRNPSLLQSDTLTSVSLIEVEPTGPTSGSIIWEWHAWNHLIQDFDPLKQNFGIVGDHPELFDINCGPTGDDWLHCNSVDYNPQLDQILLCFRNINEIWIIDHSTTTIEAAGHTGGNSGKGGDLLYRWGNPQNYKAGSANNQKFFGQHDANWIKPRCPGEGHILVFNNGLGRGYSSVDEIAPPIDYTGQYYLEPGTAYGPEDASWSYTAKPPTSFYADHISGAQRLPDGNTLICDGVAGHFFEVTQEKTTIWTYVNPYPSPMLNKVFKIQYIPPREPVAPVPDLEASGSLSWTDVKPGDIKTGSFQVQNIGSSESMLNWTINSSSVNWGTWSFSPASGVNLAPADGKITVSVSVVAPNQKNTQFEGYLRVENQDNSSDYDIIPITLKTQSKSEKNAPILHLLQRILQLFPFVQTLSKFFTTDG
ncbi:MAG: aryl-sulfate sulfotransferase [Candidatus Thermoplasmatota archaeon]|nr:aryl-sulfate sulfotransferase [Candidatus Thermoplasmatota archaeon]